MIKIEYGRDTVALLAFDCSWVQEDFQGDMQSKKQRRPTGFVAEISIKLDVIVKKLE